MHDDDGGEHQNSGRNRVATLVYHEQHNLQTLLAGHVLLRLRNVIITPHSAFYTHEAIWRILDTTLENIQNFINNNPINVVSKDQ